MNNAAIALIIFMLISKKDNSYKQILSSLSPSDIQMILDFLGVNDGLKDTIINLLPTILDGSFDFKSILPSLLPLLLGAINSSKTNSPNSYSQTSDFSEIDGLANDQIKECLKNYFI